MLMLSVEARIPLVKMRQFPVSIRDLHIKKVLVSMVDSRSVVKASKLTSGNVDRTPKMALPTKSTPDFCFDRRSDDK